MTAGWGIVIAILVYIFLISVVFSREITLFPKGKISNILKKVT